MASETAIIKVIKREIKRITNNKTIYLLSIFLPFFLFTFLAYIYNEGVVRQIPIAVCDLDKSELSHTYLQYIESTGSMKIVNYVDSQDELMDEFRKGNIYAGIYIPSDLESVIKKNGNSTIIFYNNTTNLITSNIIYRDATVISKKISGSILLKKLRSKGIPEHNILNMINPVSIEVQSLYNPYYNYLIYLVPGLIPAMLQMIIMLVSVLLISSEFTHKTFNELLETANFSLLAVFLGKSIPHILIHTATSLGILGILYPAVGIQPAGSLLPVLLFFICFMFASFFLGMAISVIIHDQLFATEIALFINTPAFIFSGFVYPLWAMPEAHTIFSQLMPFTHFLDGFLKLYFMGASLSEAGSEFFKLGIFILTSIVVTLVLLFHQKRKYLKCHR